MARNDPLRAYLRVQLQTDTELKRMFQRAAKDAAAQIRKLPKGDIRRQQLETVLRTLRKIQSDLWTGGRTNVVSITTAGRARAVEAAVRNAETLLNTVYANMPTRVAGPLRDGLDAAARENILTDSVRQRRALSRRVYRSGQHTMQALETTLRSGLLRGLSADEMAREVTRFIDPSTPGGASYAALRLARTEINNAFHEQQIRNGQRPDVDKVRWNLSGSHKVPDKCNVYASKGLFDSDKVPDKPHPQCLCYLTYETADVDDLIAMFDAGDFDAEIGRRAAAIRQAA